jgi:ABC-2 type transport system ATP-binding protein
MKRRDSGAVGVVDVRGVRKRFGAVTALDGVDLRVHPGEIHGLVGPNGAGKSTLLSTLLGLSAPDEGTVTVLDAPARPGRDGVAGFVGTPSFYPYLTGRRNLELLQRLDGAPSAAALDAALDQVGLGGRAATKVAGWSTGMRQRLGLAAALLRRPRLLVLDEPTSGLDPAAVSDVHALLRELAEQGTAVLVSSHDLTGVASMCSHVTVLARGRVRFSGTTEQLRASLSPPVHLLRTSDDDRAERIARLTPGHTVERDRHGLRVVMPHTDVLVLALAREGVAVRHLVEHADPLRRALDELTA